MLKTEVQNRVEHLKSLINSQINTIKNTLEAEENKSSYKVISFKTEHINLQEYLNYNTAFMLYESDEKSIALGEVERIEKEIDLNWNQSDISVFKDIQEKNPKIKFCFKATFPSKNKINIQLKIPLIWIIEETEGLNITLQLKALKELDQLNNLKEKTNKDSLKINTETDLISKDAFIKKVIHAKETFKNTELEKVILTKQTKIDLTRELNLSKDLMIGTKEVQKKCFLAYQSESEYFMALTPEALYKRKGRALETLAIAGTKPRSLNELEDQSLEKKLKETEEKSKEQYLVKAYIESKLAPLSEALNSDEIETLKLEKIQHLATRFQCRLKENICDMELIQALHPTPATAGLPMSEALKYIDENESKQRGQYAGILGYLSKEESKLFVTIRSILGQGSNLILTAGAGIVKTSEPESEWEELNIKLEEIKSILPHASL